MSITYEIALYPMACYPDGSSGLFNPDDDGAPQADAPEWFDVALKVYEDGFLYDPVVEFEELTWEEAQSAMSLLSKQYPDAGVDDLTQQCRCHWEPNDDVRGTVWLEAYYGTDAVEAYEHGEPLERFRAMGGVIHKLEFATEAERAAYILGAGHADGWNKQAFNIGE